MRTPASTWRSAAESGTATKPSSGRVLWKDEQAQIAPGRYYVVFEERQQLSPYEGRSVPELPLQAEFQLFLQPVETLAGRVSVS